jgi:hypothetical protein
MVDFNFTTLELKKLSFIGILKTKRLMDKTLVFFSSVK